MSSTTGPPPPDPEGFTPARRRKIHLAQAFCKKLLRGSKFQIRRKEIQIKSLRFLRRNRALSRSYADPHGVFFFCAVPASNAPRQRRGCSFAPDRFSFLLSSFQFLRLIEQVKGWRHFMIADAWTPFPPTWRPRSLIARKGILGPRSRARGTAEKTGRSIRCPARIRPLKKSPNRSRAIGKRTGASPSCLRVSHNPCLQVLSLRFAACEAEAAAFRRTR